MAKLWLAYVLWFFLGIFGVHHFYLKRDRQAFVWWATLGGLFGLGWIRDLWRLPEYVEEANEDDSFTNKNQAHKQIRKPSIGAFRFGGMMTMGYIFGYLVICAVPQDIFEEDSNKALISCFFLTAPPLAVALGVHLVANIGRIQVSAKWCLLGSGIGIIWQLRDITNLGGSCVLSSSIAWYWGLAWKPSGQPHKGKCRRISKLFVAGTVYLLLLGSSLYFNASITTEDGESVPIREAISNFFKSPAWIQTKESIGLVWQHIQVNGWQHVLKQILEVLDPQGEANAYKVLGVDESADEKEIKAKYKALAKEWHPDKQNDPVKKAEAHEKFMEIQQAYETLSKIKARRAKRNTQSSLHDEF